MPFLRNITTADPTDMKDKIMKKLLTSLYLSSSILFASSQEKSLEDYLISHNAEIAEDHMLIEQQVQFCDRLKSYNGIKTVLEVGLNAGHSADFFLMSVLI